jgi:chemotaxis signal transduction protein
MPKNVLLIDNEPGVPSWLIRHSASSPENDLLNGDEAFEQNDSAATAEPLSDESEGPDGVEMALPAKLPMSPTQALATRFDIDTASDERVSPGKTSRLASSETRLGFQVGELRFMIRDEDASQLSEIPSTHRVPNAPDWFCGISNLQGQLIPVFDLAAYFGVDPDPRAKRMLLVLSRAKDATGVLIDGLPERLRCSEAQYTDASVAPERLIPHLHGLVILDGRLWFDLNPHSLLEAFEQSLTIPR